MQIGSIASKGEEKEEEEEEEKEECVATSQVRMAHDTFSLLFFSLACSSLHDWVSFLG
jgi:hypothetical protein